MTQLAIWPFAIPMDSSGRTVDEYQGIYSRGFCWAVAAGLLRTRACEVAVCLPVTTLDDITSWAVTGREWSLEEAMEIQLPQGSDFMMCGTLSVAEIVDIHVMLVSVTQRQLVLDRWFSFRREQLPARLSGVLAALLQVMMGRTVTENESRELQRWGTNSSEAYLSYLEAWSAAAAFRFGVSVPNPHAAVESAAKAAQLDPTFAEARELQADLRSMEVKNPARKTNESIGYREFAYPVTIPGQDGVSRGSSGIVSL